MFDCCLILAGGKGTRLQPITNYKPKPLVEVNSIPFIKYLIEYLRSYGITNIVLLTGHLGDKFDEIIDNYREVSGISLRRFQTDPELNTADRVALTKEIISGDLLVCYGDVYSELDLTSYYKFFKSLESNSTSVSALSRHLKLSNDEIFNSEYAFNPIYKDIGFIGVKSKFIKDNLPQGKDMKFEDWIKESDPNHKIYIDEWLYNSLTDKFSLNSFSNQLSEKVTLILDRDGVINKKASKGNYIRSINDIQINNFFIEMLNKHKSDFERIVILTNQPWIENNKENIISHQKIMEYIKTSLKEIKIPIIYLCCPHRFEKRCACRKPKIGNLLKLITSIPLLRRKIIYVGDTIIDSQTAALIGDISFIDVELTKSKKGEEKFEKTLKSRLCSDHRYFRFCGLPHGRFD